MSSRKGPIISKQPKNIKAIAAWCAYDWGLSAYPVIITTFIIATYFTSKIAVDPIMGTHQWGNATALAGIIIAIFSPIFGAIADHGGHHKSWLGVFTVITIISAGLLWYAYPSMNYINFTLACVVLGTVGHNICMVFYNALLPNLSPPDYVGRISGWGWGLGYLGGLAALTIALYGFVEPKPAWLNAATFEQIRICGPLVAVWFAIFAFPLFIVTPEYSTNNLSMLPAIREGLKNLSHTLKTLPQQKTVLLFLIAQMIYIDGLNTIFAFGGIYAAGTFHLDMTQVILFGIAMNVFAGIGSIVFAWVDDYCGAKFMILLSLVLLTIFGLGVVLIKTVFEFWVFAGLLSLFVGPVQSSSRSLMAHLVTKEKATEMFGLYVFSGKVSTFIGPWVLGMMTLYFNSQRVGMASILIFFVIGASILWLVEEPKKIRTRA